MFGEPFDRRPMTLDERQLGLSELAPATPKPNPRGGGRKRAEPAQP